MKFLPDCSLRVSTNDDDSYYCRHSKVHVSNNVVTGHICRMCIWHAAPCTDPRPEVNEPLSTSEPTFRDKAIGFISSAAAFVADGMTLISEDEVANRLAVCSSCAEHEGNWCRRCGCNLSLKARGRAFECPLGKWPNLDA